MPDKLEFTIKIFETWVKTIKVDAETRSEARAKALADYLDEYSSTREGIAYDPASVRDDVRVDLEWPDGNPKMINDKEL